MTSSPWVMAGPRDYLLKTEPCKSDGMVCHFHYDINRRLRCPSCSHSLLLSLPITASLCFCPCLCLPLSLISLGALLLGNQGAVLESPKERPTWCGTYVFSRHAARIWGPHTAVWVSELGSWYSQTCPQPCDMALPPSEPWNDCSPQRTLDCHLLRDP